MYKLAVILRQELSRRDFLKLGGRVAPFILGVGLAGCSPQNYQDGQQQLEDFSRALSNFIDVQPIPLEHQAQLGFNSQRWGPNTIHMRYHQGFLDNSIQVVILPTEELYSNQARNNPGLRVALFEDLAGNPIIPGAVSGTKLVSARLGHFISTTNEREVLTVWWGKIPATRDQFVQMRASDFRINVAKVDSYEDLVNGRIQPELVYSVVSSGR